MCHYSTHNPEETVRIEYGSFYGSTYFGETNKLGLSDGRGIIFDATIGGVLISRFDNGEEDLGKYVWAI